MMKSVKYRLSLSLFIAILFTGTISAALTFFLALDESHELQDNTLKQITLVLKYSSGNERIPQQIGRSMEGDNEDKILVEYLPHNAAHVHASTMHFELPSTVSDGFQDVESGNKRYRILITQYSPEAKVVVGQQSDVRDDIAISSALRSLIPFLILFPVFMLVAWFVVRKAFIPLQRVADAVCSRHDNDLTPVRDKNIPDEIQPFIVSINDLLSRVDAVIQTQKRFIADAAHELRTPLTALSLQAERLSASEMSEEARQRLAVLQTGISREKRLLEQLLSLAREQQNENKTHHDSVDVVSLFRSVIETILPLATEKDIDIGILQSSEPEVLTVIVTDKNALYTAIKNVTENAVRFTPPQGRIDLSVGWERDFLVIEVEDSGPGISESEREKVFGAFYRTAGTSLPGSGLGLSIVKTCVQRLGGSITLKTSARFDTGLLVRICIPYNPC
ncbi:TPA_asm: sensor histidine kinase [Salmonella enterica subsp. enterica serovar Java]|nr:sensor histidine kinase [Salmonella enterica]EGZ3914729.1 sensor histidine kinase [Salmonella enterica subsp. enterica serovar Java]HAC6881691.1 sensor histidine kinase [Salmonella enterica subsp. enterica serovar Java]